MDGVKDNPKKICIGDEYYDIEEFFFDKEIHEYVLKLSQGSDYKTRGEISNNSN